jgi:hypothetical protein
MLSSLKACYRLSLAIKRLRSLIVFQEIPRLDYFMDTLYDLAATCDWL